MNVRHAFAVRPSLRRLARWLLAAAVFTAPLAAFAGVLVSVNIAPPPLPVYAQPIVPGPGYLWTPGYWRWSHASYFWVRGTWALAPFAGALWTPGYWGWGRGAYVFHSGYWGRHIGFYGGINYGFGYSGRGFGGGYWRGGVFNYNRSVTHISSTTGIRNVYSKTVVNHMSIADRTSFNGGAGGINARPSAAEQLAARDKHTAPTASQQQRIQAASRDTALRAAVSHGAPTIAATPTPGAFRARGVEPPAPATAQAQTPIARSVQANGTNAPARAVSRTRDVDLAPALRSRHFAPTHDGANRSDASPATRSHGSHAAPTASQSQHAVSQARPARMPQPRQRQQPDAHAPPHHSSAPRRNGQHRG